MPPSIPYDVTCKGPAHLHRCFHVSWLGIPLLRSKLDRVMLLDIMKCHQTSQKCNVSHSGTELKRAWRRCKSNTVKWTKISENCECHGLLKYLLCFVLCWKSWWHELRPATTAIGDFSSLYKTTSPQSPFSSCSGASNVCPVPWKWCGCLNFHFFLEHFRNFHFGLNIEFQSSFLILSLPCSWLCFQLELQ